MQAPPLPSEYYRSWSSRNVTAHFQEEPGQNMTLDNLSDPSGLGMDCIPDGSLWTAFSSRGFGDASVTTYSPDSGIPPQAVAEPAAFATTIFGGMSGSAHLGFGVPPEAPDNLPFSHHQDELLLAGTKPCPGHVSDFRGGKRRRPCQADEAVHIQQSEVMCAKCQKQEKENTAARKYRQRRKQLGETPPGHSATDVLPPFSSLKSLQSLADPSVSSRMHHSSLAKTKLCLGYSVLHGHRTCRAPSPSYILESEEMCRLCQIRADRNAQSRRSRAKKQREVTLRLPEAEAPSSMGLPIDTSSGEQTDLSGSAATLYPDLPVLPDRTTGSLGTQCNLQKLYDAVPRLRSENALQYESGPQTSDFGFRLRTPCRLLEIERQDPYCVTPRPKSDIPCRPREAGTMGDVMPAVPSFAN